MKSERGRHPYRERPASSDAEPRAEIDLEEWIAHLGLLVIGAAGVVVGVSGSRSVELVVGGVMMLFALRQLASKWFARRS